MEHFSRTIKPFWPSSRAREQAASTQSSARPQVYVAAISEAFFRTATPITHLSTEEVTELAAMASAKRRAQFAAGRVLLRRALQSAFGGDESCWQLGRREDGRLYASLYATRAAVSISHSATVVICAVGRSGSVGVDVEMCVPRRSGWPAMADAALHPLERERLERLPECERWRGFYHSWTLKEAFSKGLGLGLDLGFDQVAFSVEPRILAVPDRYASIASYWRFAAFEVGSGAVGAVAWSRR